MARQETPPDSDDDYDFNAHAKKNQEQSKGSSSQTKPMVNDAKTKVMPKVDGVGSSKATKPMPLVDHGKKPTQRMPKVDESKKPVHTQSMPKVDKTKKGHTPTQPMPLVDKNKKTLTRPIPLVDKDKKDHIPTKPMPPVDKTKKDRTPTQPTPPAGRSKNTPSRPKPLVDKSKKDRTPIDKHEKVVASSQPEPPVNQRRNSSVPKEPILKAKAPKDPGFPIKPRKKIVNPRTPSVPSLPKLPSFKIEIRKPQWSDEPPLDFTKFKSSSKPPSKLKTTHKKPRDIEFAKKQRKFDELPKGEQAEQEEWAKKELDLYVSVCPYRFGWNRIEGGYRCSGGSHVVSDELLAEGKGGMLILYFYGPAQFTIQAPAPAPMTSTSQSSSSKASSSGNFQLPPGVSVGALPKDMMDQINAQIASQINNMKASGEEYSSLQGVYYPDSEYGAYSKLGIMRYCGEKPKDGESLDYYLITPSLMENDPSLAAKLIKYNAEWKW